MRCEHSHQRLAHPLQAFSSHMWRAVNPHDGRCFGMPSLQHSALIKRCECTAPVSLKLDGPGEDLAFIQPKPATSGCACQSEMLALCFQSPAEHRMVSQSRTCAQASLGPQSSNRATSPVLQLVAMPSSKVQRKNNSDHAVTNGDDM